MRMVHDCVGCFPKAVRDVDGVDGDGVWFA